ncbi:MAG TPA: hypothetical protein VM715_16265 [Candidatus Acidoferrum sp.]|jgi:hypothetical protein|nr:hypothetical protein [Candidatus Acidoferrum sp.]
MKSNRKVSSTVLMAVILMMQPALSIRALAAETRAAAPRWSVQLEKIDPANLNIDAAFRVAIYENLLDEVIKTKQFKQVLRDGDRNAQELQNLVILKTTVESYTPGSETRRAVTTVSGATKLRVRNRLCTREGQIVLERTSDGSVRFFGGNLRATHNLAHNVAAALKHSTLPDVMPSVRD